MARGEHRRQAEQEGKQSKKKRISGIDAVTRREGQEIEETNRKSGGPRCWEVTKFRGGAGSAAHTHARRGRRSVEAVRRRPLCGTGARS